MIETQGCLSSPGVGCSPRPRPPLLGGGHLCIHSRAHCKSRVVGPQRLRLAFQRLCRQYSKAAVEKCAHPDQTCSRVGWDLGVVFQLELLSQPGVCSPPQPLWLCLQALALSPSGAMLPFPCGSSQAGHRLCLCQVPLPGPRRLGPCGVWVLPCPTLAYSFAFFPLTSIAYRRVIRVYQYEVGDDLSGRFFSYFSPYLTGFSPMHS